MRRIALLAWLMLAGAAAPAGGTCLRGLKPALAAGGFTGAVDCVRDRIRVRRVGDLRSHGHSFTIWAYRYQLALMCPECAIHGGRRTIVLRDGRYLGQYETNFIEPRVAHGALVLTPVHPANSPGDSLRPVAVRFSAKGPPELLHVGGEDLELVK